MAMKTRLDSMTVEVGGVPFEVFFECWPGSKGARDSLGGVPGAGPPLEPDEPADFEIVGAFVEGWDVTEFLTDEAWLRISEAVMEAEK